MLFSTGFLLLSPAGCQRPVSEREASSTAPAAVIQPAAESEVKAFCGGCHNVPEPRSFAKADWREEVQFGYRLHLDSGRADLRPPPQERVIAYYEQRAPRELRIDGPDQVAVADRPSPLRFERRDVRSEHGTTAAAVAHIDALADEFLISDMRGGAVWRWQQGLDTATKAWEVPHPAAVASLSREPGSPAGVVIADLGSFLPEDHHRGAVAWASTPHANTVQPLIPKLSRVSHVTAGDLDGDHRADLVIAEFGWRRTGRVTIGWNDPDAVPELPLNLRVLDPRHGCLKTKICDFDGDGTPDIIAAFAQEHETVERYRPVDRRQFERSTLYRAPDPAWGTSDFEVVDLDRDGRLDVLVCHGDSFDGGDLRPDHGVRWLRQQPDGTIELHVLAAMPGVHRAVAGDLDGDGDLDVAAVALLPNSILQSPTRPRLASVVWLEQVSRDQFIPHVLEWDECRHATCEMLDEDRDGDLDLVVGHFHWEGDDSRLLTVFRNGRK